MKRIPTLETSSIGKKPIFIQPMRATLQDSETSIVPEAESVHGDISVPETPIVPDNTSPLHL